MKVAFVFFNHPPTPFNSSVAALAGAVRDAGHVASALSIPLTSTVADAAERVSSSNADVIAMTAMTRDWPAARALLERIDERPFRVVGGYHASLAPRVVAECEHLDAIGIGDGERPMRRLLDALEEGRAIETSPGLWVRGPDGFVGDPPAADPELDIAALPRWDYEVFGDVPAILDCGINTFGPLADRFLPTRASRGCPYRCAYCSAPAWGRVAGFGASGGRNVRPVEALCDELASLRDRYAPDGFELWDEHFPIDVAWLRELARVYPARVGLPFKVEMHPSAATRERLDLLAEAGCALFHCGVEAGDETLRRETLERRTSDEVLARVFDDARELGIETSASVMTALPGETYAQAHATVELLASLRPDSFMWSTYMALPFTPLGDRAIDTWPRAARVRLDDAPSVATRLPSAMSDDERDRIHVELGALQQKLVAGAATNHARARPRPVAVPSRNPARETGVDVNASALAAALGFAGPDTALGESLRLNHASREAGEILLEVEAEGLIPSVLTIGRADGAPAYLTGPQLRFAYRGRDATPRLLREIEALAKRLGDADLDMLGG